MEGFPHILASKADYLAVMKLFSREQWEPAVKALLDITPTWVCTGKATKKSKEDSTHHIEEGLLYELQDKPNPNLAALGLTREEVAGWLV